MEDESSIASNFNKYFAEIGKNLVDLSFHKGYKCFFFGAKEEVQEEVNKMLGQLPINSKIHGKGGAAASDRKSVV